MKLKDHRRGFTLLELSIVLVVIAMLVGGVLVGQSMIHSAELRSVTADINRFSAAAIAFKDKYHYLPGDLPNATSFWGAKPDCSTLNLTPTPTTLTCNGNGNGYINQMGSK